jgi:phosphate transport system protein
MTRRHDHRQRDCLRHDVLQLAALVERSVIHAIDALNSGDGELAQRLLAQDEEISVAQRAINAEVLLLTARQAPMAADVRMFISSILVTAELERISDHARNIAETVAWYPNPQRVDVPTDLVCLAKRTQQLLATALHAYTQSDVAAARQLGAADGEVDTLLRRLKAAMPEEIARRPQESKAMLDHWSAALELERIADRATNIAAQTIFVVCGDVVELSLPHRAGHGAGTHAIPVIETC